MKLGPLDPGAEPGPHAGAGLLVGGGSTVDYRLSVGVHHAPGEDGGMAVMVARDGSVSIRRNDQPPADTPLWSIDMPVGPDRMPVLGQSMASSHARAAASYLLAGRVGRVATVARVTARTQNDAGVVLHFAFPDVERPWPTGSWRGRRTRGRGIGSIGTRRRGTCCGWTARGRRATWIA